MQDEASFRCLCQSVPHLNLEEASFEKLNEGLEANIYKVFSHSAGGYVVIKEPKALLFSTTMTPIYQRLRCTGKSMHC